MVPVNARGEKLPVVSLGIRDLPFIKFPPVLTCMEKMNPCGSNTAELSNDKTEKERFLGLIRSQKRGLLNTKISGNLRRSHQT